MFLLLVRTLFVDLASKRELTVYRCQAACAFQTLKRWQRIVTRVGSESGLTATESEASGTDKLPSGKLRSVKLLFWQTSAT